MNIEKVLQPSLPPASKSQLENVTHRLPMIDIAKGIGILLIVLGHSPLFKQHFPGLNETLGSIRMPFFFFISGVTFSLGNKSITDIATLRADAWLKPYAVTVLLFGAIDIFFRHSETYSTVFLGLVYATGFTVSPLALWFLPHLWLVYVVCCILLIYGKRFIDTSAKRFILLTCLVVLGAYILDGFDSDHQSNVRYGFEGFDSGLLLYGLPFSADLLPITCAFFLFGNFLSRHIKRFDLHIFRAITAFLALICLRYVFDFSMDLNYRRYDNLIVTTLQALLGIYVLLNVSLALGKITFVLNAFVSIGRASLFILLFHMPVLELTPILLAPLIGPRSIQNMLALIAAVVVSVILWKLAQQTKVTRILFFPVLNKRSTSVTAK